MSRAKPVIFGRCGLAQVVKQGLRFGDQLVHSVRKPSLHSTQFDNLAGISYINPVAQQSLLNAHRVERRFVVFDLLQKTFHFGLCLIADSKRLDLLADHGFQAVHQAEDARRLDRIAAFPSLKPQ